MFDEREENLGPTKIFARMEYCIIVAVALNENWISAAEQKKRRRHMLFAEVEKFAVIKEKVG